MIIINNIDYFIKLVTDLINDKIDSVQIIPEKNNLDVGITL